MIVKNKSNTVIKCIFHRIFSIQVLHETGTKTHLADLYIVTGKGGVDSETEKMTQFLVQV